MVEHAGAGRTAVQEAKVRAHVHGMWAAVAGRWAAYADDVDRRGAATTQLLLDGTRVGPGDRVLELACGPGGLGLAAAERVGHAGAVALSDVVPEMVAVAAARADARGLSVTTRVLDLEDIDEPDEAYDVVLCREGLMFAVDPGRALSELHRVVRPDGRLGLAVWAAKEQNPWLGLVLDAVAATVGHPVPPPGVPGPFSLGDERELVHLLDAAGFTGIRLDHDRTPLRAPSFEVWWARTTALAGPLSAVLARLDDASMATLVARLREEVIGATTSAGVELASCALVATAQRA